MQIEVRRPCGEKYKRPRRKIEGYLGVREPIEQMKHGKHEHQPEKYLGCEDDDQTDPSEAVEK